MRRYILIVLIAACLIFVGWRALRYEEHTPTHSFNLLPLEEKLIATIDLNGDSRVDLKSIIEGEDALITMNLKRPAVAQLLERTHMHYHPGLAIPLDLEYLDQNHDGLINTLDPIFNELRIIAFSQEGAEMTLLPLIFGGVHSIRLRHMNPSQHYTAVMSDKTQREVHQPPMMSETHKNKPTQ